MSLSAALLVARKRLEQRCVNHASLSQLGLALSEPVDDLLSCHGFSISQKAHARPCRQ
jgi:hypothetical protein